MFDKRTKTQILEHYELEKILANQLKAAPKEQRKILYTQLYNELFSKIKHHPQLTQIKNSLVRSQQVALELKLIKDFFKSDTVFLEIGPGDCRFSIAVAKYVKQVYAVDVSDEISRNSQLPSNLKLIISDGSSIDIAPESVDLAYSNQLLEHLHPEDVKNHLRSVYQSLVPGGVYVCLTPNALTGPHDVSRYFDDVAAGFHLKEYSVRELRDIFKEAGFSKLILKIGRSGIISMPYPLVWFYEIIFSYFPAKIRKIIGQLKFIRSFFSLKIFAIK